MKLFELRIGQPSSLCSLQLCLYQKFEILSLLPFSLTPTFFCLRAPAASQGPTPALKPKRYSCNFSFSFLLISFFTNSVEIFFLLPLLMLWFAWDSIALLLLQCDQCLYAQLGLAVNFFFNFHYVKLQSIFVLEHCYHVKTEIIQQLLQFERERFGSAQ